MREDRELMQRFLEGHQESFEKLIVKYRAGAISFAQRYIYDPFTAEDIVQESFAAIYVYRDRYKLDYAFKTYLFTIVRNKCIDYLRKKRSVPMDDVGATPDHRTPEQEMIQQEDKNIIQQKINELKEDYRTVIYLAEYEELSYNQIADIMGKNLGQVKVLIYRARKKLKKLLEREV